jgi:RNA-directed DNA polymerase
MSGDVHVRICERLGVRFPRATRLVITVSGHSTKRGWAQRALQRLEEQLIPLGVALNREKTKVANTLKVRKWLTRRKRRRKRSIGWRRWSNEYLYGVLGLYWDWKLHPLPGSEDFT